MGQKRDRKGRSPCCDKEGVRRGTWSAEEDKILVDFITENGIGNWRSVPELAGSVIFLYYYFNSILFLNVSHCFVKLF